MQKVRRVFKIRNGIDPERLPLHEASSSAVRDRSPSVDSISTNSSSSSTQTRRSPRNYGSFLPNYFTILRNPFRRSNSSQVRWTIQSFVRSRLMKFRITFTYLLVFSSSEVIAMKCNRYNSNQR